MWVTTAPLTGWLRNQRRIAALRVDIMTLWFDLEGALAADQGTLAWWTQERLLLSGLALYLTTVGVAVPDHADRLERAFAALGALAAVDESLSHEAWLLWLRPMPDDGLRGEIQRTLDFLVHRLGLAVDSRATATRAWADDVRALREVAKSLGIAQSDDWYLRSDDLPVQQEDWYMDVMETLTD
jgi:hypothetical protein